MGEPVAVGYNASYSLHLVKAGQAEKGILQLCRTLDQCSGQLGLPGWSPPGGTVAEGDGAGGRNFPLLELIPTQACVGLEQEY